MYKINFTQILIFQGVSENIVAKMCLLGKNGEAAGAVC
jgi:hypothetical protein